MENLQKRALRFLYDDYESSYEELLSKSGRVTMETNRMRTLCIEVYKTLSDLNPEFMKNIFKLRETIRPVREAYKMNLEIPRINQATFGTRSLRILGPKIWNSLPLHVKSCENLSLFKEIIKNWNGLLCNCRICNFNDQIS